MKGRQSTRRALAIGALVGFTSMATLSAGGASATTSCARPHEQEALNARVLQTELMVAALACQDQASYNSFVTKFRSELVEHGRLLRGYFERSQGGGGAKSLNALVTRLANESSQRSMVHRVGFCQQASLLFEESQRTDPGDFGSLIQKAGLQGVHGVRACGASAPTQLTVGYGAKEASLTPAAEEPRQ